MKSEQQLQEQLEASLTRAEELYNECMKHIEEKYQSQKKFYESQKQTMIDSAKKHYEASITNLKQREEEKKKKVEQKQVDSNKPRKKRMSKEQKLIEEAKQRQAKNMSEKPKPLFAKGEKEKMLEEITVEFYPKYPSYSALLEAEDTDKINRVNEEVYIRIKNKGKSVEQIVEEKKELFNTADELFNNYLRKCLIIDPKSINDISIFQGALFDLLDSDELELYENDIETDQLQYISVDEYNELVMKINPEQIDKAEEKIRLEKEEVERMKEEMKKKLSIKSKVEIPITPTITPDPEDEKVEEIVEQKVDPVEEMRKALEEDEKGALQLERQKAIEEDKKLRTFHNTTTIPMTAEHFKSQSFIKSKPEEISYPKIIMDTKQKKQIKIVPRR